MTHPLFAASILMLFSASALSAELVDPCVVSDATERCVLYSVSPRAYDVLVDLELARNQVFADSEIPAVTRSPAFLSRLAATWVKGAGNDRP